MPGAGYTSKPGLFDGYKWDSIGTRIGKLDLTVANGDYAFTIDSTDGGCGHFTGKVTAPLAQDVNETCIVHRPNADGSYPRFTNANDLHCP